MDTLSRRLPVLYGGILLAAVAVFAGVLALGRGLGPSAAAPPSPAAPGGEAGPVREVLLALLVILAVTRVLSAACRRVGQPPVMGQVAAGLLLGPSVLGLLAPGAAGFLFPETTLGPLGLVAELGVVLFMFLVGLELDEALLREQKQATILIAHAGIAVPFALGSAVALLLYPLVAAPQVPFLAFALFVGAAMAVTAFPVLAGILRDRGLQNTPLGALALSCAAIDDATAWCLLAVVIGIVRAQLTAAGVTILLAGAFVALVFLVARPLARRIAPRLEGNPGAALPAALAWLLACALATEAIGIQALFGAFLAGAVIPHDSTVARAVHARLDDLVGVLLLPVFFVLTGLHTEFGLIRGWQWALCAGVVATACVGKVGATYWAARVTGHPPREAGMLGVLMNTRGLMGLVVLEVGRDLGVVSPTVHAMLVITAVVTTLATAPLLGLLERSAVRAPAVA